MKRPYENFFASPRVVKKTLFDPPRADSPTCKTCCSCGKLVREEAAMKRGDLYWHNQCPPPKEAK